MWATVKDAPEYTVKTLFDCVYVHVPFVLRYYIKMAGLPFEDFP